MLIISNYDGMDNAKKIVIRIAKFRVGQYLFLFDIRYYWKIPLIYVYFLI